MSAGEEVGSLVCMLMVLLGGGGRLGGRGGGRKGREPPFIHHMVQPRVDSRHFRNLTTTPKLAANHNSSTWCRFGDYILRWNSFFKSPPQFG